MTLELAVLLTGLAVGQLGDRLHITGQVQDAQLDSVGGAEVAVMGLIGDDYTAPKSAELLDAIQTTGQEGRFDVNVRVEPRHDILVVARKTGLALGWEYIYREHPFMAQPYTSFTANIVLRPPGCIAGRLVDSEGHAVRDAVIQAVPQIRNGGKAVYAPQDWLSKRTDAQGRFVFDQLPVEATVRFFVKAPGRNIAYIFPPEQFQGNACEGYRVDWEDVERDLAGATFFYDALRELRVVLKPSSSIRGRVADDMGRGIAGAEVSLQFGRIRRGGRRDIHGVVHLPGTRTDAQGYYELKTLVALDGVADHYRLTYESAEFGSSGHVLDDRMIPGQAAVLPDVQLMPLDAHLSGVVLDQNNHPVPGKPVFVGSDAGGFPDSRATSTDERGQFRVDRLPAGPVSVQVDFGQGNDAAYVYAHSGDHVTIRLGQHFTNFVPQDSLVGGPLPDLRTLETGFDARRIRNKKVLVVFVDYAQRASQIAISQLQRFSRQLRDQNVAVVCIQVAPVDEDELRQWKRQNKISFPIDVLPGHGIQAKIPLLQQSSGIMSTLRQQWGVRSVPWAMLADEHQQIVATGVNIGRVLSLVHEQGTASSPLQSLRRRR